MPKRHQKSRSKVLQEAVHKYMAKHDVDHVDLEEVARWLIQIGEWQERPYDQVKRCRSQLADALRQEYFLDPQNREVRRMHPVPVTKDGQRAFEWHDIYQTPAPKFRASITLRRDGVLASLKQMKVDQDSWNDNNEFGAVLPLFDANFNPDLEELDQPDDSWPEEDPDRQD